MQGFFKSLVRMGVELGRDGAAGYDMLAYVIVHNQKTLKREHANPLVQASMDNYDARIAQKMDIV